ncbi:MAG: hypothetical protein AB1467_05870 [Candidatus Diapherotrites archaeon]
MKKEFVLMVVILLLSTQFSYYSYAQEAAAPEEGMTGFSCNTSSLTPEEVALFKDKILKEGFQGQELSSGMPPIADRDKLDNNTAVLTDLDSNQAAKIELPNQKMDVPELKYLMDYRYTGGFSIGILLDDTLRAARCKDTNSCALNGNKLSLRNSGEGIKGATKSAWNDLKELFSNKGDQQLNMDAEKKQMLKDYIESPEADQNGIEFVTASRIPGNFISNYISTDSLKASMGTTCNNSSCVISVYSMFDKHFNTWFSLDIVISNVGPVLLGRAFKLFGMAGRRGMIPFLSEGGNWDNWAVTKKIRGKLYDPEQWFGKANAYTFAKEIRRWDLGEIEWKWATGDMSMYSTSRSFDFRNKAWAPGGLFERMKTLEERKHAMNTFKYLKRFNNAEEFAAKQIDDDFKHALKQIDDQFPGALTAEQRALKEKLVAQAYAERGTGLTKLAVNYDDIIGSDFPVYLANQERTGMTYKAVFNEETKTFIPISSDPSVYNNIMYTFKGDPKYGGLGKDFAGSFQGWKRYRMKGDGIQLYQIKDVGPLEVTMDGAGLKESVMKGKFSRQVVAEIEPNKYIPVDKSTVDYIVSRNPANIKIYKSGTWGPATYLDETGREVEDVLTPKRMGEISGDYIQDRIKKTSKMTNWLYEDFIEHNWANKKYYSVLDKFQKEEEKLFKAYFSTKGGALKWTAYPYLYWWAKKGAGFKELSAYQLPSSWRYVLFSTKEGKIFDDAFIDFFANEGSDTGDMFVRIINSLPWKWVLNTVSDKFNPAKETYDKLTKPEAGLRTKVGSIAFYSYGKDDCGASCSITVTSKTGFFNANFRSIGDQKSIILEDTPEKEKKKGSMLISYAHHMNLDGKTEDSTTTEPVDLEKAIKEKTTCTDKLEEAFFGIGLAKKLGPSGAAAALGITENLSYAIFGMTGIFTSAVQQIVVASRLQDCIDTEEGYYVQFSIPPKEEQKASDKDVQKLSTEKVSDFVAGAKDKAEALFNGAGGITQDAMNNVKDQIGQLTKSAADNDLVQATLDVSGNNDGAVAGSKLFYLWIAPGDSSVASYITSGKTVVKDKNLSVELNKETGVLSANGQPVITSEDNVRLSSINTNIPAIEIPNTLTRLGLPYDSNILIFGIGLDSELIAKNNEVLDCIKEGVKEQTGIELTGENLSDAFGPVLSVITNSHPDIFISGNKIIADGLPRKVSENAPKIEIYANRQVLLLGSADNDPDVGKLESIQLKNGVIVFKLETNELIFWLKHNEKGILSQNDVQGIKVTPTTYKNPVTDCDEPAFDLNILGDPNSPALQFDAAQFNKSLAKFGPYQVFDTDKRRYIFYALPPDCIPHMRIIDKETGKVYDQPIDAIKSTPNGFQVATSDGKTHDFAFGAENGRPYLEYNGSKEQLNSMQGANGAFWYDPTKGLYYAENAQLLPLSDEFRQKGIQTMVGPDGEVKSTAGGNYMNVNIGTGQNQPFSLPSLPENPIMLILFISLLLFSFSLIQSKFSNGHYRKNRKRK